MGEYQRLPNTVRKATELIRKGDMNVFRLVEDGVFDAQGNARYNADLDKVTHYGYDGERLEKIENRRLYLNYADIPENVRKVFLDLEDTRFYKHAGDGLCEKPTREKGQKTNHAEAWQTNEEENKLNCYRLR